jgi:hypothetical protein
LTLMKNVTQKYVAMGFTEEETAEFDRGETVDCIETELIALGHQTDRIGHVRQLAARLVAGDRWDVVFNIAEGLRGAGRGAQVPAEPNAHTYVNKERRACTSRPPDASSTVPRNPSIRGPGTGSRLPWKTSTGPAAPSWCS